MKEVFFTFICVLDQLSSQFHQRMDEGLYQLMSTIGALTGHVIFQRMDRGHHLPELVESSITLCRQVIKWSMHMQKAYLDSL
jgi:hypothetical protein